MKAFIVLSFFITTIAFGQNKIDLTKSKDILIGEWKFIKVVDQDNKEIKKFQRDLKIPNKEPITIKASGPDIIINSDGTYTKIFTPKNSDTGHWRIKSNDEVEYEMVIPKDSESGKILTQTQKMFPDKKWKKDKSGNFLDGSTDKILELSATEMKVQYEKKYILIYKKVTR